MAECPNDSLILVVLSMMYVQLHIQTVECVALIDSGASENFISAHLVRFPRLQVRNLSTPCHLHVQSPVPALITRRCFPLRATLDW